MAEYNNSSNINNNRPNGANSANSAPQGSQNMGNRPNYPPRSSNYPPNQANGTQPRPFNGIPRPTSMSSRPGAPQGGIRNFPPRQSVNPAQRTGINQGAQQPRNPNLSSINRQSATERFERGSRTLSHMNGGTTGAKLYRINRPDQDAMSRRQVGGVVLDTELIQDANKQKLNSTKSKQKTAVIVVLSVLLALSLVYLIFAIAGYSKQSANPNCKYNLTSEVSAHWVVDDNTETEFSVREGLSSGKIYEIESILVIDSEDKVNIRLTITATLDGKEIFISGLDKSADNLVRVDGKNTWVYVGGHQGVGEVYLFNGIDFFGAPNNLTSENVNITVHAEITKA